MGGERGPRVLQNWRAFAALSAEEMNGGAGCCHLPAPTCSLAHQHKLNFFQTSCESLLGAQAGLEFSLELQGP